MTIYQSALEDFKFFVNRGFQPLNAALKVASIYGVSFDQTKLVDWLLAEKI